jgi:UTP--glucose-1-phosphate uridylyltransferase
VKHKKVRKAVIVAAGWGTRFLPITKTQPKEMLPLLNRPLIQVAVEELLSSGIEQIIIVTSSGKRAIEDYFDHTCALELFLEHKGDQKHLAEIQNIARMVNICTVRQKEQLGLGHALFTARDVVGDEPFAVLLPDDLIDNPVPATRQLIDIYDRCQCSVLAVENIQLPDTIKYGIIAPRKVADGVYEVLSLVEKPQPEAAPSNLGIVGRYILTPEIFPILAQTPPGKSHEIQLTDGLTRLLGEQNIYAAEFSGRRYDTGTPLGWLEANLAFALKNPEWGPELKKYLLQHIR